MSTLLQDLRYAIRVLVRSKVFSLAIIFTLALAIGANTAAFSIMNAVLFPDLLYKNRERLISIQETGTGNEINFANYDQRLKAFDFFESIGGHRIIVHYLTGNGEAKRIVGWHVTSGFLATLGTQPLLGRNFLPEEDLPGAPLKVILSEGLWDMQFSRDPHVIGKTVRMNGQPYEVIGVMPKKFRHTSPGIGPPCWTSLGADFQRMKKSHYRVFPVARLKPGMTIEQAQARVNAVAAGWKAGPDFKLVVEPLGNPIRGYEHFGESGFLVFCVAVVFVLLIACANIMNLLLARGMTREKEIALRIALGADRGRLIRQLLTETTLLCVLGGGIGLLLTFVFRDAIFRYGSQVVWILREIPINKNVVLFTAGVSVFAALFTGLLPAMQSSRVDLHTSLKEGGQRSGRGHRGDRFRSFLVVFQVALSLMLLIGAGLMLKSFQQIQKVDLGYDPKGLFTVSVELPSYKYADEAQKKNFYKSLLPRLHDVPYLQQIGVTTRLPWDVGGSAGVTTDEGSYSEQGIDYSSVSPAYLRTLGVMLLQGRHFTQRDEDHPLVIINRTAARKFWPDKQAIGRRIKVDFEGSPQYEVVGVIKDVNPSSGLPDAPHIYFAKTAGYWRWLSIVVRSNVPKEEVVAALKNAIRSVDKEVPLALDSVQFTELLSEVLQRRRMILILVTFFAGVAICLAAVGTYALVDYSTSRMHHEIGVRISVGARRNDILGLILKYGMRLAVAGIAVGLLLCLSLNRFLQSYLYGISSTDWGTYVFVSFLLIVVTLLACLIPARRAANLDPADVLRSE